MNGEQRKGTTGGGVGSGATAVTAVGIGTVTVGLVPVVATSFMVNSAPGGRSAAIAARESDANMG